MPNISWAIKETERQQRQARELSAISGELDITVAMLAERDEQLRIANQTADALAEANGKKIDEINRLNRQIVALQRENRTLNNQVQRAQIQLIQLDDLITDLTAALKAKIDEIIGG